MCGVMLVSFAAGTALPLGHLCINSGRVQVFVMTDLQALRESDVNGFMGPMGLSYAHLEPVGPGALLTGR